mmetsp:Transcript_114377/g.160547  ORF Transcript_114377/g.160547 Transcript_114377/m.160547 type:complete len:92 (+) Transcript_114377:314-589(+)
MQARLVCLTSWWLITGNIITAIKGDDNMCETCGLSIDDCVTCECPNDAKCIKLCEEELDEKTKEVEEKLADAMPEGWIERQEAKDEDDEDA